jgi:hypothetical protein
LAQRQMSISPQLGQLDFVASSPGGIVRLHDKHLGIMMFILSLTATPQGKLDITTPTYICYLLMLHLSIGKFKERT